MNKLKLMTVVGTRPEIIRLASVIKRADTCFDHILVHTGQNYDYELNQIFFDDLELRAPDVFLNVAGGQLGETIGNIIAKSFAVIQKYQPDALLVLGDTNSCLSAYAAKRLKVPVFHMEAGNRCFDQNVPEEINRKIVDSLADVNLCYTEHSRRYLLSEGGRKEYTFVTGSPMNEVLAVYKKQIDESGILEKLALEEKKFIVLSAHREENVDQESRLIDLVMAVNSVAKKYQMPIIFSLHPRSKNLIEKHQLKFHALVRMLKPLGFIDYNALQKNAFVVLSDSGTLSEESALLSFPAVLLRDSTERPEAVDSGHIVLGGTRADEILSAIEMSVRQPIDSADLHLPVDYHSQQVSKKVVKAIQSYTPIINHFCWRKES